MYNIKRKIRSRTLLVRQNRKTDIYHAEVKEIRETKPVRAKASKDGKRQLKALMFALLGGGGTKLAELRFHDSVQPRRATFTALPSHERLELPEPNDFGSFLTRAYMIDEDNRKLVYLLCERLRTAVEEAAARHRVEIVVPSSRREAVRLVGLAKHQVKLLRRMRARRKNLRKQFAAMSAEDLFVLPPTQLLRWAR
jgi:hypothetical protein